MPDPSVETYTEWTSGGARKWSGGKDLKSTQAYPELFGMNVQHLFELRAESITKWASAVAGLAEAATLSDKDWDGGDSWEDAELAPVFRLLLNF